jgi:predicted transcriptional regulator
VVIHHANKGQGGSIVSKARGTTALTAIPSQNILLSPLASENNPNDRRIQLKTQGRAGRPENLIIERTDDGWISHGDGEALVEEQRRADTVLTLPDKDAEVYAYILERTEQGFPVAQNELVANRDLKLKQYQASRLCARLVRQGLIKQSGRTEPSVKGGRPSPLFEAIGALSQKLHSTHELHETSRAHEIKGFNADNAVDALLQERGFNAPPLSAFNCPVEVQLVPGGDWTPDHITCGPAPGDQFFIRLANGDPNIRRPLPRSRIRHASVHDTTAESPSAVSPPSGATTTALEPLLGASDDQSAPDQFPYGF